MKVLLDYHHHDLWESMELLCQRLGWKLYRPIGMEWFDLGYWNHERAWHGDALARQYLEPWGSDTTIFHSNPSPYAYPNGYPGLRLDKSHNRAQKMLTIGAARDLKPDIVISSLAHNHEGFARFASEVGAVFGLQVGNVRFSEIDMREDRWDLAVFGLVSAILPAPVDKPHVIYHQEFSLTDFRHEMPPKHSGGFRVSSFVQCFPENTQTYSDFLEVAHDAPEFDWRVFGAYGQVPKDDYACGNIDRCADVGAAMRQSDVAWHAKQWSDGYGHVIHNWFAVGRPVFGFADYYRNQLAGPLWIDGITSIDLATRDKGEIIRLLRELRDEPDRHAAMCKAAAERFRETVDFDEEEQQIRAMFARVLP